MRSAPVRLVVQPIVLHRTPADALCISASARLTMVAIKELVCSQL